jgi:hypothetical protein
MSIFWARELWPHREVALVQMLFKNDGILILHALVD